MRAKTCQIAGMLDFTPIPYKDKSAFYRELRQELASLYETVWFTNLSNASAALMAHMPRLNWSGFYLFHQGELRLGPFQGLPACLSIGLGKGVCGTAALDRHTQLVADVHAFPGHITCDARSRSEIVVPMIHAGRLLGVLDLDSPEIGRFDAADQAGLEELVAELIAKTTWPDEF